MRNRPLTLTLFSLILMGVGLSIPIQAIYLQDFSNLFRSLTILNMIISILCLLTAVSAAHVHTSFRYLLIATIGAVIFNNWWVGKVGFDFTFTQTTIASLSFVGLCSILLEKKAFTVLSNPNLKWWNIALRKQVQIPVSIVKIRGETMIKKAFDISESGLFLQGLEKKELEKYEVGEYLYLYLHFNEILKISCRARIVRKTNANGNYPAGIGLQFANSNDETRLTIKKLIADPSFSLQLNQVS
jgi:hypothetical protein